MDGPSDRITANLLAYSLYKHDIVLGIKLTGLELQILEQPIVHLTKVDLPKLAEIGPTQKLNLVEFHSLCSLFNLFNLCIL